MWELEYKREDRLVIKVETLKAMLGNLESKKHQLAIDDLDHYLLTAQINLIHNIIKTAQEEMKEINDDLYLPSDEDDTKPYLYGLEVSVRRKYNPKYDDNAECECGHSE